MVLVFVFSRNQLSEDRDHMCRKAFLRESWSWSSSFSFPKTPGERTGSGCLGRPCDSQCNRGDSRESIQNIRAIRANRLKPAIRNVLENPKGGAHKRGLKPRFFRENRGEILPGKSGLFGADWGLSKVCSGLFGADRDQFLRPSQPRGKSRNCPERALFGPIGAFRAKPPFAKPPFGFHEMFQCPATRFAKKGVQLRNPQIRANQAIRSTLRIDYAAPTGAFFLSWNFARSRVLGRDFFNRFQSPY